MFTGLIEEIGIIKGVAIGYKSGRLKIGCSKMLEDIKIGDSISVNGICLTVTSFDNSTFEVDFMPETAKVTNISFMNTGSRVNLERALMVGDRLGGHIVSGHVDGFGTIVSFKEFENSTVVEIEAERTLMKYIIKKGSIAIDGASLTVGDITKDSFILSIIPHTKKETTLLDKKIGEKINIECDSIGKYIERILDFKEKDVVPMTMEFLNKNGFM